MYVTYVMFVLHSLYITYVLPKLYSMIKYYLHKNEYTLRNPYLGSFLISVVIISLSRAGDYCSAYWRFFCNIHEKYTIFNHIKRN